MEPGFLQPAACSLAYCAQPWLQSPHIISPVGSGCGAGCTARGGQRVDRCMCPMSQLAAARRQSALGTAPQAPWVLARAPAACCTYDVAGAMPCPADACSPTRPAPCRHARDFVAAADAAGVGACVTLSVVDVNNGTIVLSEQVHTGRTMPTNYDTPPRQYEFEYSSSSSQDGSGASSGGLVVVVVLLAVRVAMRVALRDHEEDELGGVRRTPGDLEMGTTNQATPGRPLAAHPPLAHPPTAHYHQPLPTVDPD